MSAPRIPNLLTLKPTSTRTRKNAESTDEIVQRTDLDAAASRISAVETGYLDDPFARLLNTDPVQRRLPLMNRGTYVRTTGIDKLVDVFLSIDTGPKQIVSLGAGSDTRFFRLKRTNPDLNITYHEIDFSVTNISKILRIKSTEFRNAARDLCSIDIDQYETFNDTLTSTEYNIHAQDLRKLPQQWPGIRTEVPTLLISECCLIYLSPDEADNVLDYFVNLLSKNPLAIVIYEPIRPNDPFGRTMVRNLTARGIQLKTFEKYAELQYQRKRLQDLGFAACAEDIDFIWRKWIHESERERVEKLEWMDEIEEFVLFARHYCISWGWMGWSDNKKWEDLLTSGSHATI